MCGWGCMKPYNLKWQHTEKQYMYLSHDAANEVTVTGIISRSFSMSRNLYIFILFVGVYWAHVYRGLSRGSCVGTIYANPSRVGGIQALFSPTWYQSRGPGFEPTRPCISAARFPLRLSCAETCCGLRRALDLLRATPGSHAVGGMMDYG